MRRTSQGATVSLLNPYDNTDVVATGVTDATGSDPHQRPRRRLPPASRGHRPLHLRDSYTVIAGITNSDEVFIANQFVTYTWQVAPADDDPGHRPAPDHLPDGRAGARRDHHRAARIPTLQPGNRRTFNLTLTNHGLIAAQGVTLTLPTDPEYTFTALSPVLGVVAANSSVTVPVTVYRAALAQDLVSASSSESEPCTLDIPATYFFICAGIPHELTSAVTIHIPGRVCDDVGKVIAALASVLSNIPTISVPQIPLPPPIPIVENPLPQAGAGPEPNDEPSITTPSAPYVSTPTNCNPCIDALLAAIVKITFDVAPGTRLINPAIAITKVADAEINGGELNGVDFLDAALGVADLGGLAKISRRSAKRRPATSRRP